jgi:hypothetical protein
MKQVIHQVEDALTKSRKKSSTEFIEYLKGRLNVHFNIKLDNAQAENIYRIALTRFGSANIRYHEETKYEEDIEKIINITNNIPNHSHQDVEVGIENDVMLELYFQHKELFKEHEKSIRAVVKESIKYNVKPNIHDLVFELNQIIEPLFIKEENKEGINFEGVFGSTTKEVKSKPSLEDAFGPIDNKGLSTEGVFVELENLKKLKNEIKGNINEELSLEGVFRK